MIGTNVRGVHHLARMAKASLETKIIFFFESLHRIGNGTAIYVDGKKHKNPYHAGDGDYIMIFNDITSNVKPNHSVFNGTELEERIQKASCTLSGLWVITLGKRMPREDSKLMSRIIALPETFDKDYACFCTANKKQLPNITKYADVNSAIIKYFYMIANGSKNFFFWAANAHFKQGIHISLLEKVMVWNDNYSQLSSKLSKGTITAYNNVRDIFRLVSEMVALRRDKRANDVINMFNTAQKKALKGFSLGMRDYDTLSKFAKLSSKKKSNFIRKMSTIEDPAEILKQMSFLSDVHFEWNKQSLLDSIKNNDVFKCDIVLDKGNMLLLKVHNYETVKRLAKTTNWCISKDKKYWNQYVEHNPDASQYVLMDFDKKEDDDMSIIGFTSIFDRGITNAHDFQNKNIMGERPNNSLAEIKVFTCSGAVSDNIYSVLDKYGIKLSDVVAYEPNQFEWNRESMFDYLNQCVNEDDYYIIYDDGTRVVLIVENDNVIYFLGDAYINNYGNSRGVGDQYIIFADFSKSNNDSDKFVFGIIVNDYENHESKCSRLYNSRADVLTQSFDSKIEEFGLPYDIICRKNDPVERFYTALGSYEVSTAKDLIKNEAVKEDLMSKNKAQIIRDIMMQVTFVYFSSDYIDLFYDNGIKLSDVIGTRYTSDIMNRLYNNVVDTDDGSLSVPSKDMIEQLNNRAITNNRDAIHVGFFITLMKMINGEDDDNVFYRMVSNIRERNLVCGLYDAIMSAALSRISANYGDTIKYIAAYAYKLNSTRLIKEIEAKEIKNPSAIEFIKAITNNKSRSFTYIADTDSTWTTAATINTTVAADAAFR